MFYSSLLFRPLGYTVSGVFIQCLSFELSSSLLSEIDGALNYLVTYFRL